MKRRARRDGPEPTKLELEAAAEIARRTRLKDEFRRALPRNLAVTVIAVVVITLYYVVRHRSDFHF